MSRAYPDVIENIKEISGPHLDNFILDGELVAYDIVNNAILPF